jgi:hypothetical protein
LSAKFLESQVIRLLQESLPGRTDLFTEEDGPVRIVYPGRPNDDRGADLRDAVIDTGRGLVTGDIEVHVRSSGWRAHDHHEDPVYNRVVLHVVFWNDAPRAVFLQNGRRVPTLALHRFAAPPPRRSRQRGKAGGWAAPCRGAARRLGAGRIGEVLDRAGDRRFLAAAAGFGAAASRVEAGQALYRGVLRALGFARNKHPMAKLAGRLPLSKLEAALPAHLTNGEWLAGCQALLMGTAGLLPSQRRSGPTSRWAEKLEEMWRAGGGTAAMPADEWQSFKTRPGNLPVRRLAAMGYLLLRYRHEGLLAGLLEYLDRLPGEGPPGLESGLVVAAEGPWAAELDFGIPAGRNPPALLGNGRAADIVINVLLPFAAAWGRSLRRPDLAGKARELYRAYPRAAENTLERHMRAQAGLDRRLVNSARRQQGLLHVFKTRCSQGGCTECEMKDQGSGNRL